MKEKYLQSFRSQGFHVVWNYYMLFNLKHHTTSLYSPPPAALQRGPQMKRALTRLTSTASTELVTGKDRSWTLRVVCPVRLKPQDDRRLHASKTKYYQDQPQSILNKRRAFNQCGPCEKNGVGPTLLNAEDDDNKKKNDW
ncbi:hypothetical protein CBL_06838 [Carabus blaptoides fortunei]